MIGKTVPLYAGTHSPCASRALHLKAAGNRGTNTTSRQRETHADAVPSPLQESFQLMVNTPPQERPPPPPVASSSAPQPQPQTYDYAGDDHNTFFETDTFNDPRTSDDVLRRGSLLPAATAAAALASLHNHRAEYDWDSDPVRASYYIHPPLVQG